MKTIVITFVAALGLAASSAYAGCGMKVASIGKLEKFDAATKTLTIVVTESSDAKEIKSKTATLTLTPSSKVIADGKVDAVKADDLVGKNITVVSEHGKIDYVIAMAAKS
jgi:hypothetical protein